MRSILIVDDDSEWADTTIEYLNAHGFDAKTIQNSEEALIEIKDKFYDVLVIDYDLISGGVGSLPTGLHVIRKIREFNVVVPIILTSGKLEHIPDNDQIYLEAIKLGIVDFFQKGPGAASLLSLVNKNEIRFDDIFKAFVLWYEGLSNKNNPIIVSSSGESFSAKNIIEEIKKGTDFGKSIKEKLATFSLEVLN